MIKIGIREFRNNLKENMGKLPIALTHRGQTVAIIVSTDFFEYINDRITSTPRRGGKVQEVGEAGYGGGDEEEGSSSSTS